MKGFQKFEIKFNLHLEAKVPGKDIKGLEKLYTYLIGRQFLIDFRIEYGKRATLSELRDIARQIVEEEIYTKNTTDGTGRIKASFDTVLKSNEIELITYSRPEIAPSVGPFEDGNPDDFSYAAFFEKPGINPEFNSFLPGLHTDPHSETRYRPFMTPMVTAIKTASHYAAVLAYLTVVKRQLPARGKA